MMIMLENEQTGVICCADFLINEGFNVECDDDFGMEHDDDFGPECGDHS